MVNDFLAVYEWRPKSVRGELVPHVAIHQSEGYFHPIGSKVADEPWLKEETPEMALKQSPT